MATQLLNAVVVGCSRGIGLALSKRLQASGKYAVIGVQRGAETKTQTEVGFSRIVTGVDITKPDTVASLKQELKDVPVSLLVVVSGILNPDKFSDFDSILEHFNVNTIGHMRVVDALSENLGKQSRVALLTSRMGSIADNTSGGVHGYRISKAALNMFGKSLAVDWRSRDISVVLVHPGAVETDMTAQFNAKAVTTCEECKGETDCTKGHTVSVTHSANQIFKTVESMSQENTGAFIHAISQKVLPW